MTTTALVVLIVVIVCVLTFAALYVWRQRRSKMLRSRFGPEYERAVRQFGGRTQAEQALEARQHRREKIHLRTLTASERERFAEEWHQVQGSFVDNPSVSLREADRLVRDLMSTRGYPMTDFERRAEDISVDYPHVVQHYRAAHGIAVRDARGDATTEDVRRALVFYRDLFDELLETRPASVRR